MTIRAKPTAEVAIDTSLVRALLQEQHADLAHFSLIEVGEGWDNKLFRLGEDLAVRVPRRAASAALIEHEQRWLPRLSPTIAFASSRAAPCRPSGLRVPVVVVRRPLVSRPECAARVRHGTSGDDGRRSGSISSRAPPTRTGGRSTQPVARCTPCGSCRDGAGAPPAARRARRPRRRAGSVGARSFDTCVVRTTIVDPRRSSPRQSAGQRRPSLGRDRLRRSRCWRSCDGPVGSLDVAAAVCAAHLPHISTRRIRSARRPHVDARTRMGARAGTRVPG